ncbi:2-hydroxyacid dehydrogenase [Flavobacterium sp. UBA7682]|uniref:2-hydroxyacid dehydrogenase n=1 Tax=Flavobacterium sp. UBA7682 TaxID=1946560 RepID=UPI0025B86729|nr:2-hydroxyacid dehydrogenase [Flavobacterium sp. UBA7682]
MKIFVYSTHRFEKPFLQKAANDNHELIFSAFALEADTAKLANGCKAIIAFTSDDLSADVLDDLYYHGIRFIALRSVGFDHVDLLKAKQLGIKVANVPNYSPYSTAEHAVALLLALNRKLMVGQKLMKRNDFSLDELIGFDMYQKTIGIVGVGKIGGAFAKIMSGFGCRLLGYDPIENKGLALKTGLVYTTLEEVCQQADVVSIHCPLTPETRYMFNKVLFAQMKKGVLLINTARGSIVNTIDLLAALDNKTIAGAGLDVYENEKGIFFRNHLNTIIIDQLFDKLRNNQNVIITGHQAFLTQEALTDIATTTFYNLNQWEKGKSSTNEF